MYFIKEVSRATKENPNFAGEVSIGVYGKAQELVALSGSHAERVHMVQEFNPYFAKDYGFKRECDARKSWIFRNPENSRFWESEVSIIWLDC